MMTTMRENMPLIMWILVGAFLATIVFSWGMGGFKTRGQLDGVIGRVGGKEILYDQYNRMIQDRVAQQRSGDEKVQITDAQIRQIRKDVWDELVRNRIMEVYADRWKLVTSDNEVAWAVRNSPPNWIRENENFQTDGKFDLSKYEQFLKDPRSSDILVSIEKDYRSSMSYQKVIDRIISPVFVTTEEAWDDFLATNRKFNAAVVTFSSRDFPVDSNSITAQEIEAYYTDHRKEYRRPERRRLLYVSIPVTATKEDTTRVLETAQEVLSQAQSNADFAQLAQEYSEDEGSAKQGGDLGYFTSGRMVKEFDSTCFATDTGKVVGPVYTRFGAHIIKVIDRKKGGATGDSVRASHVLIKWSVGSDTEERIAQKAKDFADAAKSDGWDQAAAKFGLETLETDGFIRNPSGNIPGFGALQPAMDWAFASKPGSLSNIYKTKLKGQDVYAAFQMKEVLPEVIPPVNEVESGVRGAIIRERQKQLAEQEAARFRTRVNDAAGFMTEALRESLKVDTTGDHAPRDFVRSWGTDEDIGKAVFALQPGQISQPLSNSRGAYIVLLLNRTEPNDKDFESQRNDIVQRLRQGKQNNVYADWLAQAKDEIGVEDNRYLYYNDY